MGEKIKRHWWGNNCPACGEASYFWEDHVLTTDPADPENYDEIVSWHKECYVALTEVANS